MTNRVVNSRVLRVGCGALAVVAIVAVCGQAVAQPTSARRRAADIAVKRHVDLEYARVGDRPLRLDLYLPQNVEKPSLVVWIHGGAWRKGSKGNGGRVRFLTGHGFAVADIDYRLSQEAVFPAQIFDCKAAIRWLRGNAKKYGYDAKRIGVAGSSAGGHLVALLGTSGDVKDLEGKLGDHLDQSSRVQAVCDMWGPTDFLQMGGWHNLADSPESQLVGGPIQKNKAKAARANPITYVSKDNPPFLLIHGDEDHAVPLNQSELLKAALDKAGVPAQMQVLKGVGHGARGFPAEKMNTMVLAFFDKRLTTTSATDTQSNRESVSLFDGKTLDGWVVRTGKATYCVQDGAIVGRTATEGPNTFLCTKHEYDNFELTLDVKCDPELNSGIQIRSHAYKKDTPQASRPDRIREAGTVYGYQVEISANGNAGRVWDEARQTKWHDPEPPDAARKAYRPGKWNQYRIVARGDRIQTWINGVPIADFSDKADVRGFIGLQVHRLPPDKGPFEVRWKKIRLRELSVRQPADKIW